MSLYFDPKDKKNKIYIDYFENKSWLVIENSTSARSSIKKTLTQIGAKTANLLEADNITEAENLITTQKPHYIIANKMIQGTSSLHLFEVHIKTLPNRLKAGFFIITEANSLAEVAWALDYEMDGIISLPLNGAIIIQSIIKGVQRKLQPTAYLNKIEDGRNSYLIGELDKAVEQFKSSLLLEKNAFEAMTFLGQIYTEQNLLPEAIEAFEKSLLLNSSYFKTLNKLGLLYYQQKDYKKSYDINLLMAEHYPTAPERIPELIRLSIINKKYEDISNYYKVFQTIKSPAPTMQNSLSAGLAILGKYFSTINDSERGIEALKSAFAFSNGKYEILKSVVNSFETLNRTDVLLELFENTDLSLWPKEGQSIYFHTLHLNSSDDQKVIQEGEKLLKSNIRDPQMYRDIISRSIKMKRKTGYIENIVLEAQKHYPEQASEFDALLNSISKA